MRILIVEDYLPLLHSMETGLREAGYAVDTAVDGVEGLALARSTTYDAIVLDLMLPKLDGLAVLTELRRQQQAVPVLIVTARSAIDDRVQGLDLGADDYLVKPFAFEELLARLRSLVRRSYQSASSVLSVADLELDTAGRTVRRGGKTITLSAREYALLEYLLARHGQVVTRAEIWTHVYDFATEPSSNVVDVYIGYLRRKIDRDYAVKLIHTRRGMGYVVEERG